MVGVVGVVGAGEVAVAVLRLSWAVRRWLATVSATVSAGDDGRGPRERGRVRA